MLKKMVGAVALMALGAAILASAPAPASATTWENTSRGWEIDVNERGLCSAFRRYEGDTYFMLGWRPKEKAFWVGFGRDAWAGKITKGENYNVTFETDGRRWNGGDFRGNVNDQGTHGSLHSEGTLTWDFVDALAKANTVRFKVDGKSVLTLQLDGSHEALVKTIQCQKEQGERTSDPAPAAPTAPTAPTAPRVSRF